jgi:hypothetical protein
MSIEKKKDRAKKYIDGLTNDKEVDLALDRLGIGATSDTKNESSGFIEIDANADRIFEKYQEVFKRLA